MLNVINLIKSIFLLRFLNESLCSNICSNSLYLKRNQFENSRKKTRILQMI